MRDSLGLISRIPWHDLACPESAFPQLPITRGAFPEATEQALAGFRSWLCRRTAYRVPNRRLVSLTELAALSILEEISYTRKDGQYLRWDYRSGRSRASRPFDKGPIPDFAEA
ncbi:MAG: hypothetical protein RMJ82_08565, partial [Gemmatales bacterium]|nr:hypothetical protein [Gemmatales bacterium]